MGAYLNEGMGGFGALAQMNQTLKLNRELLGKSKRKPFDKEGYLHVRSENVQWNERKATVDELQLIQSRAQWETRKERIKSLWILVTSILLTGFIFWTFVYYVWR